MFLDIGLSNIYITSKSQATKAKINKWAYIKLKIFCTARNVQQNEKATYGMGKYVWKSEKGLDSNYVKNSHNPIAKQMAIIRKTSDKY